jgi:argininosuccinate synthase
MFSKVSNKRKSAEGLALENGLHEEEKNIKELTEVPSEGNEKTEAADMEMHFEKKVKLEDDDPKPAKLVSISNSFQ